MASRSLSASEPDWRVSVDASDSAWHVAMTSNDRAELTSALRRNLVSRAERCAERKAIRADLRRCSNRAHEAIAESLRLLGAMNDVGPTATATDIEPVPWSSLTEREDADSFDVEAMNAHGQKLNRIYALGLALIFGVGALLAWLGCSPDPG